MIMHGVRGEGLELMDAIGQESRGYTKSIEARGHCC
jgi:hypothetical protein